MTVVKVFFVMILLIAGACRPGDEAEEAVVKEAKSGKWSPGLSEAEQDTLFRIANDSLDWGLAGAKGKFDFSGYTLTKKLKEDTATFVTLKIEGMLRGCIGTLEPGEQLYLSVHHNSLNAAFRDPRFNALTVQERPQIKLDVSILSPIREIADVSHLRIGEHGIIMTKGRARAVYLPEVAVEQEWNVEQTLSSLSQKAGLPEDAWKEGAVFSVFSSVVISN